MRSTRRGYRANPIWDIVHEVKFEMEDLSRAIKEAIPVRKYRPAAEYYTLYLTYNGLIQAHECVEKHPDRCFWIDGIGMVRHGRTELDKAWGEGGQKSSEIVGRSVVARWPAIRDHL